MNYGRYQILREVGRGAMGVVYEARDPNIDRIVALKVLRQDRIATETFIKRFLKEAKVIGRLSHPRIVTIYDVGEDNGTVYIAMEFLDGVSLSDLIRDKHLDAEKVVELGTQIAATLEYAHQKGVVHRDVKPSNIIVRPDGQIKITDFGIAHIEDPSATLQTQAGEIMGTPAYMSPEQVQGQPVDCRSDIFSLGIILYELSTGMRPFGGEGKSLATIFNEIMLTTPHEPCKESASIPKALSKIIMKALEKEPGKRFQTGMELADALQHCLMKIEKAGETPKPTSRNAIRLGLSITATLTAAIVAGGIYFLYQHKESLPEKQLKGSGLVKLSPPPVNTQPAPLKPVPAPVKTLPAPETLPTVKPAPVPVKPAPVALKAAPEPSKPAPVPSKPAPVALKPAPVPSKPAPAKPAPVKPALATIARPPIPPRTDIMKAETKPPEIPKKTGTKPTAPLSTPSAPKPLPKFAFLKVRSIPKGASVSINGTLRGTTPLTMKLGLGEYNVRISHPGYSDSESRIKLEKMTNYPLTEKLKPIK